MRLAPNMRAPVNGFIWLLKFSFVAGPIRGRTALRAWTRLDVVKYRRLVEKNRGLDKIGTLHQNKEHGSANFYAIPVKELRPAFIGSHGI